MKRDEIIRTLQGQNAELKRQFGVKALSLFGSVARDEATSASEWTYWLNSIARSDISALFALQDHLEKLPGRPVDLGTLASLKPRIGERVMGELIRVT